MSLGESIDEIAKRYGNPKEAQAFRNTMNLLAAAESERTFTALFECEPPDGNGPWFHVEENKLWKTENKRYTVYEKRGFRTPKAVLSFDTLEEAIEWTERKVDNL
jgi:hypothetical protein